MSVGHVEDGWFAPRTKFVRMKFARAREEAGAVWRHAAGRNVDRSQVRVDVPGSGVEQRRVLFF